MDDAGGDHTEPDGKRPRLRDTSTIFLDVSDDGSGCIPCITSNSCYCRHVDMCQLNPCTKSVRSSEDPVCSCEDRLYLGAASWSDCAYRTSSVAPALSAHSQMLFDYLSAFLASAGEGFGSRQRLRWFGTLKGCLKHLKPLNFKALASDAEPAPNEEPINTGSSQLTWGCPAAVVSNIVMPWYDEARPRISFSTTISVRETVCGYDMLSPGDPDYDLAWVRAGTIRDVDEQMNIQSDCSNLRKLSRGSTHMGLRGSTTKDYDHFFRSYGIPAGHRWRLRKAIASCYAKATAVLFQWSIRGGRNEAYYKCPWPVLDAGDYVLYFFPDPGECDRSWQATEVIKRFYIHTKCKEAAPRIQKIMEKYPNVTTRVCRADDFADIQLSKAFRTLINPKLSDPDAKLIACTAEVIRYLRKHGIQSFMLDSGAGTDLVSVRDSAKLRELQRLVDEVVYYNTCNGTTSASHVLDLFIQCISLKTSPYVLKSTPPILSMGVRCLNEGYTYVWVGGKTPVLITPDGACAILMTLNGVVPWLANDAPTVSMPCGRSLLDKCGISAHGSGKIMLSLPESVERFTPAFAGVLRHSSVDGGEDADIEGPSAADRSGIGEGCSHELLKGESPSASVGAGPRTKAEWAEWRKAKTAAHLMTHVPFNQYCPGCVEGRTKNARRYVGAAESKKDLKWGDCVTFDQSDVTGFDQMVGIGNVSSSLQIKDLGTGLVGFKIV